MSDTEARIELDVRRAGIEDAPAMREYALRNTNFFAPWEPLRTSGSVTIEAIEARLTEPSRIQFLAIHDEHVVGQAALANIARAPVYLNCTIGYSVDQHHQGIGIASALVAHAVREAFVVEGLHRVEAGTLLHNAGSQRVLEKCGFTRIGVSPKLVRIAGTWQDHMLYAITVEDLD
jgi:ribosomal-protein-alanine N-acetyltransferase